MPAQRNPWLPFVLVVLVASALVGLTWINYQFSVKNPGGNDFLARWTGAHYWVMKGVSPYDPSVSLAAQEMIYGRPANPAAGEDAAQFVYPLYSMIFFGPFGALDYTLARALWMTLLEACLVAVAIVSVRAADWRLSTLGMAGVLLFSLLWYNGARTVILGQFSGIAALLIVGAIYLAYKKHDFSAGVLLALSLSKPQMSFLIVPFVILWALSTRRWALIFSTTVTFGLLLLASFAFVPGWLLEWLRQMVAYPEYTARVGSLVSIIAGSMPGISQPLSIFLYSIFGLYLLIEWIRCWGRDEHWFLWTALMTLVVTNIVAPRTATPHYVALLPALFILFKVCQERWGVPGKVLEGVLLALLFFGQWGLFLGTLHGTDESAAMYLPIPFLCLVGLWWVRWWVIRPPMVFYDRLQGRA